MTITPLQAAKLQAKKVGWDGLTEEERIMCLSSKRWRLNNLYWIRDKEGEEVRFKMNFAQRWLFKNLWYLNIILKARQMGFCLDPSTKVLTANLEWVRIDSLQAGDEVVSVDEHPPGGRGRGRKMQTATVKAVVVVWDKAYRITFDDGRTVTCTGQHPWLSKNKIKQPKWRSIKNGPNAEGWLKVGNFVRWVTKPWESADATFEDGWFGGMLDGEGSMSLPKATGVEVNVSQVHGPVWDRLVRYGDNNGYNYRIEEDRQPERSGKFGKRPVPKMCISRMDELFRLIGMTKPSRFKSRRFWEGKELPGKRNGDVGWAKIVSIEPLEEQVMIDLQTSTGTYIAEGFVSHNTTFIDLYMLDECIFNSGVEAGIIAHNKDDVTKIFRRKIQFPYSRLPKEIKDSVWPISDSKTEMQFSNGSIISVGVSFRSGTAQYLHISEHGKICAKYPDKAEEIKTGALEAVAKGQMVFIESTAEGRGGDFAEFCRIARKLLDEGAELTDMDYRFHFFPWFMDPSYTIDNHEIVVIDNEMAQYFDDLKRMHGIELTAGQMAWYVKKEATQRDKMKREYPSTPDEAFEAAIKGAYWSKEIQVLRQKRRIRNVPHDPALLVYTGWDLGRKDFTCIWFFQYYGNQYRIIDFYMNNQKFIGEYVKVLRDKKAELGYNYGHHYLPHDIEVTDLSSENQLTRLQILESLGLKNIEMIKRESDLRNEEGVNAVRAILPRCWFDRTKCEDTLWKYTESKKISGLGALENYQQKWDDKLGEPSKHPLHNWPSDPSNAFIMVARGFSETIEYSPSDVEPEEEAAY